MPVRVLIAEDESLTALTLRVQLESQGYEVVGVARTGAEAVDLCQSGCPDVVLMDVRMPQMDGIEATRAVMRKRPTCVVIVSGVAQPAKTAEAEQAGAMCYIVKPLMGSQIPSVVSTAQQRFDRFKMIRAQAADCKDALETWVLVQRAVKMLMEESRQPEDAAYSRLQGAASDSGISLRAAAEEVLARNRCW